ncbi:helix-turn-helix domain-containing protein [Lactococcus lactis subsp. cremoris]|nr:helix-turn-helix domain-containing protein [Lactococcus cremoris]MRM79373.1 helix-turn-helix domain-containing protein [Lactococcus cremoris]
MRKNRIKELRKAQKITLINLVDLLAKKGIKVNDSQLSKFERGTSSPRNEDIWEALAEIFDVSLAYVMGMEMGLVNIYPPTLYHILS